MKKALVILALTATIVAATANDAFAQRRAAVRSGGVSRGYYRGGNGYYGRGDGYYGRGYGYYGGRYYGGLGLGIGIGRGYYDGTPYYSDSYADPIVQVPAYDSRPSYYGPTASEVANVTVLVPRADAKVWFDGAPTAQQGTERTFHTPALDAGTYTYSVRARWMENGQPVERERRINVQPGRSVTVSFQGQSGESVPLPK